MGDGEEKAFVFPFSYVWIMFRSEGVNDSVL